MWSLVNCTFCRRRGPLYARMWAPGPLVHQLSTKITSKTNNPRIFMKALSMHILVVLSIVVAFIWPNSPWLVGNLRFEQNSMLFGYPWGSATWPPSMSSLFCRGGCQGGSSQISWWIPSTAVVGYLPPQPDHNFFGPPVNILEHVRETRTPQIPVPLF